MSNWSKSATCFLSLLAFATSAAAQLSGIAGTWAFVSTLQPDHDCTISGRAVIAPAPERNVYSVHTTSTEICPNARWEAEQDCTARRNGQRLDIACALVRVSPQNYEADNFTLTIVSNDLMRGVLLSSREGGATWRRTEALVS